MTAEAGIPAVPTYLPVDTERADGQHLLLPHFGGPGLGDPRHIRQGHQLHCARTLGPHGTWWPPWGSRIRTRGVPDY